MEPNTENRLPAGKTQKIPEIFRRQDAGASCEIIASGLFSVASADSHPGFFRSYNEDSFVYCLGNTPEEPVMLAVADGIGGHGNGNYASGLTIRLLTAFWRDFREKLPLDTKVVAGELNRAIRSIGKRIFMLNGAAGIKMPMGSTLAMLVLLPGCALTVHLGDSRVYRVRGDRIDQLTEDHSYIAGLLREGALTPEQAESHPLAHVILRSIGPTASVEPEIRTHDFRKGDRFILCSDGLTTHLSNPRIGELVRKAPAAQDAVRALLHATLREGAKDNVTIVCMYS